MKTQFIPAYLQRWSRPQNYFGANWPDYFIAPVHRNRDSDCLAQSNFETVLAALKKLPPFEHPDEDTDSRFVVTENHWSVGWIEWIAIHETDAAALRLADDFARRLENYPVLDEDDFSRREQEEADNFWRDCYSQKERVAYVRRYRNQFEFRGLRDAIACLRGDYFGGWTSDFLN